MEQSAQIGVAQLGRIAEEISAEQRSRRENRGTGLRPVIVSGRAATEVQPSSRATGARVVPARPTAELLIRLFDMVGSLAMLLFAAPVMLVVAILIKLTSHGPVLYRQERVGKDGKVFTLYKFRTMIDDAEKHLGPVWAAPDDRRITSVGRILRRMRLDELPPTGGN